MPRKKAKKKTSTKTTDIPELVQKRNFSTGYCLLFMAGVWLVVFNQIIFGIGHFWEDTYLLDFPRRIFARDCFMQFTFPHWNPYTFNGIPFHAAMLAGVLYPFNIFMSFLPLSATAYWYVLELIICLHYLFAGFSMFYFLRNKNVTRTAALFGGTSYMLCGFSVAHLVHPMMINIVTWLPLILLYLEKGMKNKRMNYMIYSGLILGATALAGHPQIMVYQFLFVTIYSFYVWFECDDKKIAHFLFPIITLTIGVGISLIQLLPAMELRGVSARIKWTYEAASEGSISIRQMLTMVMPKVFGGWTGAKTGLLSKIPPFWLKDSPNAGFYTYWDTCFYAGIGILVFAFASFKDIKKDRFILFGLIWCAFALVFSLGKHFIIYWIVFKFVPLLNTFRAPARLLFTFNFLIAALAAYYFDRITFGQEKTARKPLLIIIGVFGAVGIFTALGGLKMLWPELSVKNHGGFAALQGWILILHAGVLATLIFLFNKKVISSKQFRRFLVLALAFDMALFAFGHHYNRSGGGPHHYGQNPELPREFKKQGKTEIFRVNTRQFLLSNIEKIGRQSPIMLMKRNQGMIDRVQMVDGYDPLNLLKRLPPVHGDRFAMVLDLLNVKYYINPDQKTVKQKPILVNPDYLPRVKMFYSVKLFDNDTLVGDFMREGPFNYRKDLLLTEKPAISLPGPGAKIKNSAKVTSYNVNSMKIDVETDKAGMLFVSELFYSAFKAYVDGEKAKIYNADYSFRAVEIPKGKHTVEFKFQSGYFTIGAWIAFLTILSSCLYLALPFMRRLKVK